MIEIRSCCLKCFLTVALIVCTFFVGSDARANEGSSGAFASASAHAGAGASALSSVSAFGGAGDFSRVYDGHKGIRSYDSISLSHDNDANRGTKSYGIIPGHGTSGDGIRGSDHGYNKNDCSKCKWENDDYWEQDEPEEEGDENDGDECDDGQYKPDGTHHHGAGGHDRGHKSGSHPPGVHKTGPIDVYVNDEPKGSRPASSFGGVEYPVPATGYAAPTRGFATGSTPKPGSGWNTPFAYTTSKPGYAGTTASSYGTTSNSWLNWNRGTTPGGFASSSNPTWGNSGPAGNFVTTPKPSWAIGSGASTGQPFSQKPWNTGLDNAPVASSSKPGGWNTGFDNTPTADFSQKSLPGWNLPSAGRESTGNFGVTPNYGPSGNSGFDSSSVRGLPFPPKPGQSWNAPSDNKSKPSSNPDYGTKSTGTGCPRPDSSCTQAKQGPFKLGATPIDIDRMKGSESPSGISSAVPQTGSGIFSPNSYGSPKEDQNSPYGQSGTAQSTSAYAGASVTSGIGSTPHGGTPFEKKDHPFFNKPAGTQTSYSGRDQAHPSSGTFNPGSVSDYNKPGRESTWPSNVANTFGTTKRPFGGISSSDTEVQDTTFRLGKLPGSPGSGVHNYPGVTKPSYGSGITSSSLNTDQPASGRNIWHSPETTDSHAGVSVSTTGFGTTKSPFGHINIPGSAAFDSSYSGTGLKQPGFNAASSSASANTGVSAFETFPGTYSTPYIAGTTPRYEGAPTYPGVKNSPGSTGFTYEIAPHGTHSYAEAGAWSGKQPGSGSKAWPGEQPGSGATPGVYGTLSDTWPGKQPEDSSGSWPSKKPGDGKGSSTWPRGQPGSVSATWSTRQPDSGAGSWPSGNPGDGSNAASGSYPGVGSGIRPNKQPAGGNGAWPSKQPEAGSGIGTSGCSSVNCEGSISPYGGNSNCGGGNYNCKGSCTGRDNNAPVTHGPCGETVNGPSGVNKTYYPAGTGDGHVPSIGNVYEPAPPFNSGIGAYSGTNIGCRSGDNSCNQAASVTPEGPVQWNSANPFLFGTGGGTPSDVSHPWSSGTTVKPIGKGNPFLDPDWNGPKLDHSNSNANNDKNVIPHGEGNPFLDDNKRRGNIEVNPNEGVIPLGGRKAEGYNPFFGSGNSGSDSPSHSGGQSDRYPALGTPESGGVKGDSRRVSPQQEASSGVYPTGGNSRGIDPLRCKLGLFGCGTPGSGSYDTSSGKHPGGVFGGIGGDVGTSSGNSGYVGTSGNTGTGTRDQFGTGHPASAGSNLAGSVNGAYAGSFSNAQTSNFPSAKSLPSSNTAGTGNDFGQARSGSWSSSGAHGGSNSWASSSAFASSSSGSWSGNYPTDVKG
ncbi:fibroin heavy chain-like [Cataglyphis hispanica]|uniref:fibroin heavy chain-like n=1 Tax=Cataglyphis hispanica TaxID=1086592 RepID=UPI0021801F42|nr:fibroin heavy chain-like [Cataglyphis hispanica]